MNKEGLVSLPGYLAIYLLGLSAGEHVLRSASPVKTKASSTESAEEHSRRHAEKRRTELALELFGYAIAWWSALGMCRMLGGKVSRRLVSEPSLLVSGIRVCEPSMPTKQANQAFQSECDIGVY